MRTVVILILLMIPGAAYADQEWRWYNTAAEVACEAAIFADWRTTREFTGNPHEYPNTYEENPVLGEHPSARRVNVYAAGYMILHPVISWALGKTGIPAAREIWQLSTFFVSFEAAEMNNHRTYGVTMSMRIF